MTFPTARFALSVALAAGFVLAATPSAAQSVIRMEEITIEGQIQKPQASFILQRSGEIDLGVDVRSFRPRMTAEYARMPEQRPELFRMDRRR